jgi:hypothetical protein
MRCPIKKAAAPNAKNIGLCLSKSKKISPSEPQKSAQIMVLIYLLIDLSDQSYIIMIQTGKGLTYFIALSMLRVSMVI